MNSHKIHIYKYRILKKYFQFFWPRNKYLYKCQLLKVAVSGVRVSPSYLADSLLNYQNFGWISWELYHLYSFPTSRTVNSYTSHKWDSYLFDGKGKAEPKCPHWILLVSDKMRCEGKVTTSSEIIIIAATIFASILSTRN
jgi:hypothetical protein